MIQVTVWLHTNEFNFVWFYKNENGRQNRSSGAKTELLRPSSTRCSLNCQLIPSKSFFGYFSQYRKKLLINYELKIFNKYLESFSFWDYKTLYNSSYGSLGSWKDNEEIQVLSKCIINTHMFFFIFSYSQYIKRWTILSVGIQFICVIWWSFFLVFEQNTK